VRFEEIKVSIDLVRQAIENIPDGPVKKALPPIYTEGRDKPYRVKISPASFRNFFVIEQMPKIQEIKLADVPPLIYSFDPWFLDADR